MTSERRCERCEFWHDFAIGEYSNGECRAKPPRASHGDDAPAAVWPVTHAYDWCARFESRRPLVGSRPFGSVILRGEAAKKALSLIQSNSLNLLAAAALIRGEQLCLRVEVVGDEMSLKISSGDEGGS